MFEKFEVVVVGELDVEDCEVEVFVVDDCFGLFCGFDGDGFVVFVL